MSLEIEVLHRQGEFTLDVRFCAVCGIVRP